MPWVPFISLSNGQSIIHIINTPTHQMFYCPCNLCRKTGSNDSRLHVMEPPRGISFIWQIGVNSSIQDWRKVDQDFVMESSQSYVATLTHYSTEPLTTGLDYDPLFLLLALVGDVHPNPGLPRYPCSVCFKCVTSSIAQSVAC